MASATARMQVTCAVTTSRTQRPSQLPARTSLPVGIKQRRIQRSAALTRLRAAGGDSDQDKPAAEQPTPAPPRDVKPPMEVVDAGAQRTAIVTGAVSIIFGIIYLALVFFLDSRGGEMLPPPPEAYGP